MTMNKWQMAALVAGIAGITGAACLVDIKQRNKSRPIFTSTERPESKQNADPAKADLEKMVKDSQVWTFNEKEISAELRDYRAPRATKFYFVMSEGDKTVDQVKEPEKYKLLMNKYNDFQDLFLLKLYNKLEPVIGNRGFTGSEMLQLLSFYVDKVSRGADRYEITSDEVDAAIAKLEGEGPAGFKIRLEKVLETEKVPMISNGKKPINPIEAKKQEEKEAYQSFQAGQRYAGNVKKGNQQYTREQLDQYARENRATIDAELKSRLWRDSPRYCPNR